MFRKTITLGLDYSQFVGGTQEINRKLRLLDDEFKLASEQAKGFGDESDQLRIKQEALRQKIILQQKAVEEMKKAYDKAAQSGEAGSKKLDYADSQLLKARTALEKSKNELASVNDQLGSATDKTGTFGDGIRNLASTIGLETNPMVEGLASKLDKVSKGTGVAITAIGALVGGLIKCSVSAAGAADDLLTLSSVTGVSTENLQKLSYASDLVDVSVDTIQGSMAKMVRTMDSAKKGTEETSDAYRKLHVRLTDATGGMRDSEDVFYDVVDALGRISNETERDALAMTVFGRSAQELNPLIEAGSGALREFGDEAERMGTIMSDRELQKLGSLQDSMDRLKQAGEGLKNNLGLVLAPALTMLFETLNKMSVEQMKALAEIITTLVAAFAVFKLVMTIVDSVDKLKNFFTVSEKGMGSLTAKILAVVIALAALAAIIAIIAGKTNDIERVGASVGNMAADINKNVGQTQRGAGYNARGTQNFQGGRTWVGEAGPEIVELPEGSRIYSNAESREMSGGDTYNIYMQPDSIREYNNLIYSVENRRRIERMG